jgi:hypothetical protein
MPKRVSTLATNPRFMRPQEFEDEAAILLAEFGKAQGQVSSPPVPIDDIVAYLKIATEFKDLRAEFPEGDVLGAIWFSRKLIAIDKSLVPEDFPATLARYRFTLAHELGHWRLHRHLYLRNAGQQSLFGSEQARPDHVLRGRQSDPKEVQANRFAACLLMPREMIKRAWHELHGDLNPIYLPDLRAKYGDRAADDVLLGDAIRPLAVQFEVSVEAMRIRSEEFGLLLRKKQPSLFE